MSNGNAVTLRTAGRDPGARAPAPGSLRLIQALVNTLNAEHGIDLLGTRAEAAAWLTAAGLLAAGARPLTGAEQQAFTELREAIRGVLAAHADRVDNPAAASRLSVALSSCRLGLAVEPSGAVRITCADHDPFTRAIGAVASAIAEAAVAGTWARLKSCPGHLCGWAFYDRSASGRSRWCAMQLCGSRSKMRDYRGRQARQPAQLPSGTAQAP
ncbi:MAG TPA: CGNR zinc finger domain-containing protein [Streptosporangiaceae bacterium]